jgi:transcriptional regulator with XRE-family HTH domain
VPQPPKATVVSKEEIGIRLRMLRQQRAVTQVELAKMLGVHQANISAMERGIRSLTIHQVIKLSNALKVSTDELLKGDKIKPDKRISQDLRLLRRMQRIQKLSTRGQRAVLRFLDALLDEQIGGNGGRRR